MLVKASVLTSKHAQQEFIAIWQSLEDELPNVPFFMSTRWQKAVLEINAHALEALYFCVDDKIVGACLNGVCEQHFCGLTFRQSFLNQTGVQALDQQWVEYNDVFALPEFEHDSRQAYVRYCCKTVKSDAVFLRTARFPESFWVNNEHPQEQDEVKGYLIRLPEPINANFDTVLSQFSSNTRSQVRRAIKYIEQQYGPVTCSLLRGEEALNEFDSMAQLHAQRWRESEFGSGFDNPVFCRFHRNLLSSDSDKEQCHVLSFTTPKLHLGYLYNFVKNGHVYFYLSAINYADNNNKFKVGLVMHALAQTFYAERGCHTYDFMGGECRYKASLSNESYRFYNVSLYCNPIKNQILKSANKLKALLN